MNITESNQNGIHVFAVGGRIDTLSASAVERTLQGAVSQGKHNIVLDMSDVNYINSAGSRTLANVLVRIRARGGDLKLAALSQRALHVFRIIGFDKVFALYDTVEMALAGF
ncbi:MAG: STAS domain-containing protein [Anaerolineae bacterium]